MTFQELKKELSQGRLSNNKFILYSKDEYSVRSSLDMFKKLIIMPELNISEINLNTLKDASDIIAQCETLPCMGNKRLILIRADFLSEDSKDKLDLVKSLEKYLTDLPEFTIVVMFFYSKDKRENISKNKKVKKLEKSSVSLITNPKNQSLEKKQIIDSFCKVNQKSIPGDIIKFIISNSSNLDMLINDLDKIKYMTNINIETVREVFSSIEDDDIFDLTDAIGKNEGVKAIEIINNLLAKGIQPMQLVNNIIRQYKMLLYCKVSLMNKLPEQDAAKELKLHPYVCKLLRSQSNHFDMEKIALSLENCINLEVKIKTISIDSKSELELLLVNSLL